MNCKYLDVVIYLVTSSKTAPYIQSHITRNYENINKDYLYYQMHNITHTNMYVYDTSISSQLYKINELCYKNNNSKCSLQNASLWLYFYCKRVT